MVKVRIQTIAIGIELAECHFDRIISGSNLLPNRCLPFFEFQASLQHLLFGTGGAVHQLKHRISDKRQRAHCVSHILHKNR